MNRYRVEAGPDRGTWIAYCEATDDAEVFSSWAEAQHYAVMRNVPHHRPTGQEQADAR